MLLLLSGLRVYTADRDVHGILSSFSRLPLTTALPLARGIGLVCSASIARYVRSTPPARRCVGYACDVTLAVTSF